MDTFARLKRKRAVIMFQLYIILILSGLLLAAAAPMTNNNIMQSLSEQPNGTDTLMKSRAAMQTPHNSFPNLRAVNKFIKIGAASASPDDGRGGDVARSRPRNMKSTEVGEPVLVRQRRRAVRRSEQRWPNAIVPYKLESSLDELSNHSRAIIQSAFEHWQSRTCIRFVPHDPLIHENWIVIGKGNWCNSMIGMIGGSQRINMALACLTRGTVVHELGHALGWPHEQSRPDRDDHVMIRWSYVPANAKSNYNKVEGSAFDTHNLPYDHESIMHYPGNVIVSRDLSKQHLFGQRRMLSFYDVKLANLMYKCAERSGCDMTNVECTDDGYVGPACKCVCPYGSNLCTVRKDSGNVTGIASQTTTVVESHCTIWNKAVEGAYIAGHNDAVMSGVTVEECKEHCAMQRSFRCASIDYWFERRQCYLSSVSLRSAGVQLSRDQGMAYYERDPSTILRRSEPC